MSAGTVLVIANQPITDFINGPAIRAWELAHILAEDNTVTLATTNAAPPASPAISVRCYRDGSLPRLLDQHDVVVACGYPLRRNPVIQRRARHLVVDIYDPYLVENLHLHQHLETRDQVRLHEYSIDSVLEHLHAGDFFICASERQRDYWLGALSLANRINPRTHQADPTLRRLVDVVPFGLPSEAAIPSSRAIKGVVPGIDRDDVVVLWGGGIWDWLDPLTAIRAMVGLEVRCPKLKLYFMGMRQPNSSALRMEMPERARHLAQELGLLGRTVFFHEGWVPYQERVNFLSDADIAITLHREHVETRLAFRTRVLDYLWATLPIISTHGDALCELVVEAGAGISVADGDVENVRSALQSLAEDPARRSAIRKQARTLAGRFTWAEVARPLLDYCRDPWRAADKVESAMMRPRMARKRLMLRRLVQVMRDNGSGEVARLGRQWLTGLSKAKSAGTSGRGK